MNMVFCNGCNRPLHSTEWTCSCNVFGMEPYTERRSHGPKELWMELGHATILFSLQCSKLFEERRRLLFAAASRLSAGNFELILESVGLSDRLEFKASKQEHGHMIPASYLQGLRSKKKNIGANSIGISSIEDAMLASMPWQVLVGYLEHKTRMDKQ